MGRSADFAKAGERIAIGKMMNAGQICLAPDYLIVPEDKQDEAVAGVNASGQRDVFRACSTMTTMPRLFPTAISNGFRGSSADARDKGAEVIEVNPGAGGFRQRQPAQDAAHHPQECE